MARIVSRHVKLSKPIIIFQFPDGRFLKVNINFMYHFFGTPGIQLYSFTFSLHFSLIHIDNNDKMIDTNLEDIITVWINADPLLPFLLVEALLATPVPHTLPSPHLIPRPTGGRARSEL